MRTKNIVAACVMAALTLTAASRASAVQLWSVHHGQSIVTLDTAVLKEHGLTVQPSARAPEGSTADRIVLAVSAVEDPVVVDSPDGRSSPSQITSGELHHRDGLVFRTTKTEYIVGDWVIPLTAQASNADPGLALHSANVVFDHVSGVVVVECDEVAISDALAAALGDSSLAGLVIGRTVTQGYMSGDRLDRPEDGEITSAEEDPTAPRTACSGSTGPDVIVGDVVVDSGSNYATSGSIDAFSWGTTSCNMGTQNLQWVASSVNHPVIPQNMYRLKTVNGAARFEQVGMSWLKHGFTALTQNLCCTCNGQGGSVLGVGCSDPYTSSRNGTQCTTVGGLGPRFQVNAHSGAFIWPYFARNNCTYIPNTSVTRRCQVQTSDLNPTLNSGALYYAEAQYVTPDDATARNQDNNCSYERITISGTDPNYSASSAGATVRESPAIKAWKTGDASVTETTINTPEAANAGGDNTGTCILSAKATNIGGNTYHYEYALFNMNSDRSISTFKVPAANGLTVTNIGFHDIFYHDGDGFGSTTGAPVTFDGADWPGVYSGGTVTWALVPASPIENSNALRWGTLYNFRFDCDSPPIAGDATLGLFKAVSGQPNTITASTVGPTPPSGSCCAIDGGCTVTLESNCIGTSWTAFGVCVPNTCPQPTGSCCAADGGCTVTTAANCTGTWTEAGVCDPNPCSQPPTGSCCYDNGSCTDGLTEANCAGAWTEGGICTPNPCPPCTCPGDLNASNTVDGGDIGPLTDMFVNVAGVSNCADLAEPYDGSLDSADMDQFVDLLVNGTNTCP